MALGPETMHVSNTVNIGESVLHLSIHTGLIQILGEDAMLDALSCMYALSHLLRLFLNCNVCEKLRLRLWGSLALPRAMATTAPCASRQQRVIDMTCYLHAEYGSTCFRRVSYSCMDIHGLRAHCHLQLYPSSTGPACQAGCNGQCQRCNAVLF